jgi:hypothetical protein
MCYIFLFRELTPPPPLAGSATGEWSGERAAEVPAHNPERELRLERNFLFGFIVTH